MNKEIINSWYLHKDKLENYFRTTRQKEYNSYKKLIKLVVKYFLPEYSSKKITVIDDGDYQGTQIFLIPKNDYQPSVEDYLYTHNYYGSCSGCDTLLEISEYEDGLPTEKQVKDYMTLCLHLIQRLKPLTNDEFEVEKLESKDER